MTEKIAYIIAYFMVNPLSWVLICLLPILLRVIKKKSKSKRKYQYEEPLSNLNLTNDLPIKGMYERNWILTQNEKIQYRRLKTIADELGYTVFTKVRLLDLVEPKKGNPKYKTYFYKIQAKHIDFVLCDNVKLVAQVLIEIDDSSHDTPERMERDKFVDEVVQSVGYKIIHARAITPEIKELITGKSEDEKLPDVGPVELKL